jgi:hypothetical protein
MTNLGQYIAEILLDEKRYQNVDDAYEAIVMDEESEIERTAQVFNVPIPDMRYAFVAGNMVVLSDNIWSKLENSDSYDINSLEDAIALAKKYGKDWKPTLDAVKSNKAINPPLVLNYDKDKYYLVGGNTRLMFYKALGKIPKVLMATLNLGQPKQTKLMESKTAIIGEFIKYTIKNLKIQNPPRNLSLSYDNAKAKEIKSFGYFNPNENKIWVYVGNRNMGDILRTLAHELVHRKQEEDGRLKPNSGETGSEIENEANAQAGVLLRKFGEKNPMIYERLIKERVYGDYLFGDKDSGVVIGWYKDEIEPDTPAEKNLFNLLKKYANSEFSTYSSISLDDFIPVFKQLKKQYPEIVDPKLPSNTYLYRGTSLPKEQINRLVNSKADNIINYEQGYIILNQIYQSKRKIQSWSTNYFIASGFAFTSAAKKEEVPIIIRIKVSDADLYFKPEFVDKLSTQAEDETFNIINPISADIMVMEFYEDEFEDTEAGYLHTKK